MFVEDTKSLCPIFTQSEKGIHLAADAGMSQAFVKEGDEQWLHEVQPTLRALILHLTRENNGIRVYEQRQYIEARTGREVYVMSNGMHYAKDADGRWEIVG